jgi:diguanylate cyclase (GGDEF)-like protein
MDVNHLNPYINPNLKKIIEEITAYDEMYDLIRMVDPIQKKVLSYDNNAWHVEPGFCYDVYEEGHICKNCVSVRAINTDRTSIKTQFVKDKLHMVTAVPIVFEGRKIVFELFKDIADSQDLMQEQLKEMQNLIVKTNELLVTDVLTNVYNRRFIEERLPVDFATHQTMGIDAQIVMIDIDFFKHVNDQYGHLMGDKVLKDVARLMKQAFSETEIIARYGGEEFLIYDPRPFTETLKATENLRKNIETYPFVYENKIIHITVSAGIQTVGKASPKDAIHGADEKLYVAKTTGRNRVISA